MTKLTFEFHVPGWTRDQINALTNEVLAQAEANDDHPEAMANEGSAPSFDDCEDAGLDGTLRTSGAPATWEEVARAALARLREAVTP